MPTFHTNLTLWTMKGVGSDTLRHKHSQVQQLRETSTSYQEKLHPDIATVVVVAESIVRHAANA